MLTCANCGLESPDSFRYCPACAALLDQPAVSAREERKVVTVLFADLVGFTSRSEQLDPEDVRAVLAPYHARLRDELERYGGTCSSREIARAGASAPPSCKSFARSVPST